MNADRKLVITITPESRRVIFWGIIYWGVLLLSYSWALQNHFGTLFVLDFNGLKCIIASILVMMLLIAVPHENTIYSFFIIVLLYVVVLPIGCIYCCVNESSIYFFTVAILFICVEIAIRRLSLNHVRLQLQRANNSSKLVVYFAVAFVIINLGLLFRERGLPNLSALDFNAVYDIRASYSADTVAVSLAKFSTNVLIPFLITISFIKKKKVFLFAFFGSQFLIYLWTAHKSVLFSIGVLVIGYLLSKMNDRNYIFSKVFTLVIGVSTVLEGINGSLINTFNINIYSIYGIIVRRFIFVPAYIKRYYYSYFVVQDNSLAGFFGTIIAPILTRINAPNPYRNVSYAKMIGNLYVNGVNANTGAFGGELAHFGFAGLFVAAICLLIVLICVKSSEQSTGKVFACCCSLYSVMSLSNGKAMDVIAFSPLLLLCIILMTFCINEDESRYKMLV